MGNFHFFVKRLHECFNRVALWVLRIDSIVFSSKSAEKFLEGCWVEWWTNCPYDGFEEYHSQRRCCWVHWCLVVHQSMIPFLQLENVLVCPEQLKCAFYQILAQKGPCLSLAMVLGLSGSNRFLCYLWCKHLIKNAILKTIFHPPPHFLIIIWGCLFGFLRWFNVEMASV